MNEIQQRIDTLCKLKKISKYRLAKNAGIPYTTLSNAYRNDTMPTIPTLMSICEGLGITMAQFFMDDEDKQCICQLKTGPLIRSKNGPLLSPL